MVSVSAVIVAVALATGIGVLAQSPTQFVGLINDYGPNSVTPTGPWEVRGAWLLTLKGDSGTADFSAELTMERSDYWVLNKRTNSDC